MNSHNPSVHQLTISPLHDAHDREAVAVGNELLDQYLTPEYGAERLLDIYFGDLSRNDLVVDPGCGRGAFLKAVPQFVPAYGVEIDPDLAAEAVANSGRDVLVGDFRTIELPQQPTAVIGNPPFRSELAKAFLARARDILPENGRCGFILPTSHISFASTLQEMLKDWSIQADVLPRDLFPRLRVPISFYLFTKNHLRRHHGFVLFDEASAVRGMPRFAKLALYRGENQRSPWHTVVKEALVRLGGEAPLERIYAAIGGKLPSPITTWKDTVRRVLQEGGFINVTRGVWALPASA